MPVIKASKLTAREYCAQVKARPNRAKFGFGKRTVQLNNELPRDFNNHEIQLALRSSWVELEARFIVVEKLQASPSTLTKSSTLATNCPRNLIAPAIPGCWPSAFTRG